MDRTGLSGAGAGKLLARLWIKEFGDGGDRNLRQGLGLYGIGIDGRAEFAALSKDASSHILQLSRDDSFVMLLPNTISSNLTWTNPYSSVSSESLPMSLHQ